MNDLPQKRDWYVLHVKPRTEKKVAKYLAFYRFFCHLPRRKYIVEGMA